MDFFCAETYHSSLLCFSCLCSSVRYSFLSHLPSSELLPCSRLPYSVRPHFDRVLRYGAVPVLKEGRTASPSELVWATRGNSKLYVDIQETGLLPALQLLELGISGTDPLLSFSSEPSRTLLGKNFDIKHHSLTSTRLDEPWVLRLPWYTGMSLSCFLPLYLLSQFASFRK